MAWFDTGRTETVQSQFTLTARHAGGFGYLNPPPVCEGGARVQGPQFEAQLVSERAHVVGGTSFFRLAILFPSSAAWVFRSAPVPDPPATWGYTVSVTVSINFPARERKEARIPGPPTGAYDWLPSDVELQYALHPTPGANVTVETTSSDPAFNQSLTRSSDAFGTETDIAPHLSIGVGGIARNFTGLIAEVTSVTCSAAVLNFNDGESPSSGFDFSTTNGRCFTTANSIRLELIHPNGLEGAFGQCHVYPAMSWKYDGWVRTFADPYPGDPVIHDHTTNVDDTATGGHLTQNFPNLRRFDWSVTLTDTGGSPQSQSQQLNEHPGSIKAELQEVWTTSRGEDVNDRRILLEDDKVWDAMTLSRQSSVVIEPLNDAAGWAYTTGEAAPITVEGNALKTSPLSEDSEISKTVSHYLGAYRYLKIDLKSDVPATPVRITLGTYYWDVLVEIENVFETKTLDLAAPHNATTFDDVVGLQDIQVIRFGNLQPDVTYWFANMRLERKDTDDSTPPQTFAHRDELRVLPPFQQDGILFHLCNGRPGLTENFRDGNTLRSIQNVVDSINNRLDSGFSATAIDSGHPYYNPNAPAGFLQDRVPSDENFASPLTLNGQVRADRIIPWAGMGDPTQSLPNSGTLTVKFTKYVRGKVEGLVFIRDLSPSDKITTRIKVRKDSADQDMRETDKLRYYRTAVHLKAGTYEVVRIDENNNLGIPQSAQIVNRQVGQVHLRARVWDKVTKLPINEAEVFAEQIEDWGYGSGLSSSEGLYAVAPLPLGNYLLHPDAVDYSRLLLENVALLETHLLDVDFPLLYAGGVNGVVTSAQTGQPVAGALVYMEQSEPPYIGWGVDTTDEQGQFTIYQLDISGPSNPSATTYDVYARARGFSLKVQSQLAVSSPPAPHQITAQTDPALSSAGVMTGRVTDQGGAPIEGAMVRASQIDGTGTGWDIATTDANGDYTMSDLDAPGNYEVSCNHEGHSRQVVSPVSVSSTTVQNFILSPAGTITGTIRDQNGTPISGAVAYAIQTNPSTSEERNEGADANGVYEIADLEPGTYEVSGRTVDYVFSETVTGVIVSSGATTIVDLQINLPPP